MALQVWLPGIADILDQGLSGITWTNHSTTMADEGKMGKSINFAGSQYLSANKRVITSSTVTVAFWVYLTSTSTNQCIVCCRNTNSKAFAVYSLPSGLRLDTGSNWATGYIPTVNTWTHVCFTCEGSTQKLYINGSQIATRSSTLDSSTVSEMITIGCQHIDGASLGTYLLGRLNDFRIYDNALSAKEVRLLSRGLVLHYPLAPPGGDNLIKNTAEMATNMWGYGAKASRIIEDGVPVVKLEGTSANWTSDIDSPKSVGTQYLIPYSDVRNKTVTFSCWVKANQEIGNTITFSLRTAASATRTKYYSPYKIPITTEWKRVSFTTTVTDASFVSGSGTPADTDYFFVQMYNHVDDVIIYIKGWKLEYGDKATTWMPNAVDDEYTAMGFGDGIEYDVSGFKNNGTKYGNLNWSNDTPRYNACYEFDGTGDYIRLQQDEYDRFRLARDELTVNIWAYKDDWSDYTGSGITGQWNTLFSCAEGGGWVLFERGNGIIQYSVGTGSTTNAYKSKDTATGYAGTLSAGWHMFTMTYDGLTLLGYIDGELVTNTTAAYTEKTPIFYKNGTASVYVGTECGASTSGGFYWTGKLSDFRVYETALSSADILELYQTGASLASNGTLMTSEFVESI